ncbi:MAG: hypothetical protein DCC55_27315 [Chloroflexi bacterium]|nr:MAG: hypothetical protein DCC55_27315 [Chloroflexota bacterium]
MHFNRFPHPDHWLQNAASLAMSALLARLDLAHDARPFFWIDLRQQPPQASHSYWDRCDIAGRFVDGLVLARQMTGRTDHVDAEILLRDFLWAQQDPEDGLFYNWEGDNQPNAEMSKYLPDLDSSTFHRHVDLFCQRSPLLAMTTLLALGDESMRPRLQQMVRGLLTLAERTGDELRFPTYRWAREIRPEWVQGTNAPEKWLGYRYALLTGLARYVELAEEPEAVDLALGLARFYMRHGDVPPDGRFAANTHSGGVLPATVGIARLGVWAGDTEMVAWANRVYLWVRENTPEFGFLLDGLGLDGFFAGTCETCGLADLVHLALVLTEAGAGDHWDDIERIARNQLLENQYRHPDRIRQLYPGIAENVLAMMHGGFECAAYPNRLLTWVGVEGCCIGGGIRALYLAWRGALTDRDGESWVNLGFSRTTPAVQVIGHEPWRGQIDVRAHAPRQVHIRVPGHAGRAQVRTLIEGQDADVGWQGPYATFALQAGQTATLSYPLPESNRSYQIAGQTYQARWRGATMVEIQPTGEGYPTYQRQHLWAEDSSAEAEPPQVAETPEPVPFLW